MAARPPGSGGISEIAVNAALAFIEGAKPRDEVEAALVIQMACTHSAAMAVLRRVGGGHGGDRSLSLMATAASRLLRAYATQVEALRRLRNGGSQTIRIRHVHVEDGGRAVVGVLAEAAPAKLGDLVLDGLGLSRHHLRLRTIARTTGSFGSARFRS